MEELLLKLLRYSLWGNTFSEKLSAEEFRGVLSLAEDQTVFGLVFDVLKGMDIGCFKDKMPIYEAIAMVEQIKLQNRNVNKELADFSTVCEKSGLEYIVVKGQTLGCLYPNPMLRSSGDIDFLMKEEYDIVKEGAEKALGVSLPEKMLEKQVAFDRNNIEYELHTCLRTWANGKHQKVWDELTAKEWQKEYYVEIEGQKIRTLSPTMNAAYIFIHLFFHFIREGVSLRQMCDWAMVLHHYKDEIDREELRRILTELDMFRAYRAFGCILVDDLGLPVGDFPFLIGEDSRKWHDGIIDDIFRSGNFGKLNHKAHSSWRYKLETMKIAARNSLKYGSLAPIEAGLLIPRLLLGNLKIIMKKVR